MKFLEKDLEEIIFKSDKKTILKRGLKLPRFLKRQLRIGKYGVADLVGFDVVKDSQSLTGFRNVFTIFELKQDKISVSAFFQALRYAKGVKSFLEKKYQWNCPEPIIKIVLIGSSIDLTSDVCYTTDILNSNLFMIDLITYSYELEGLKFTHHYGFKLMDEGF